MLLGSLRSFFGGPGTTGSRLRRPSAATPGRLLVGGLSLALAFTFGCGGSTGSSSGSGGNSSSSGGGSNSLTVTVKPGSASVAENGTQQFTATVTNDPANQGVTWTLTSGGTACAPGCGTISVTTSASGAPTTYTAPGTAAGATLTATSISNPAVFASASISVAGGISVLVSPPSAAVPLGATYNFTATVVNDTANKGVNWTLLQNGVACTSTCGKLSATSTASGTAVTYTAPTAAPSNNIVTLTASSISAPNATSSATITIQGTTSVSVSPTYANVPVNGTQTFTATVTGGTGSQAVTWQLMQNGTACSSGCGTLTGATTGTSNSSITYTAPGSSATFTLVATSTANTALTGSATIIIQPVSVSVSPTFANIYPSQTLSLTAKVNNDVSQKGVNWTLTENGQACSSTCGAISPTQTGGGVATTYTAPSTIQSPLTVLAVATSVADNTASASATLNLYPPVAVSVSPSTATVPINSRATFTATVTNDPTNAGVTWALLQSGKSCSPACGGVSPTSTASGVATTYFAPSTVPSPATVTLTATSAVAIKSAASATITVSASATQAKLNGSYAFLFNGYDSGGAVAAAGTFTADGAGNITGGTADVNTASVVTTDQSLTGTYSVGADNVGTLTLTSSPQGTPLGTFQFALNSAGDGAQFAELGDSGERGAGTFQKQTLSGLSPASVLGNYAFSASGADAAGGRLGLAGIFRADGHGNISSGVLDTNDAGVVASELPVTGNYSVSSAGRGTIAVATPAGVLNWAFYVVSPKEVYLVSTADRLVQPLSSGKALAQSPSDPSGFSAASLDGTSVIDFAGAGSKPNSSQVSAGLVTFDGSGGLEFRLDQNDAGKVQTLAGSGTYSVTPDGRVKMTLPALGESFVSYLVGANRALLVNAGPSASLGALESRDPGVFTNASLSGNYVLGTVAAPTSASSFEWGVVKSTIPGKLDGTAGSVSASRGLVPLGSFSDTFAVSPEGRAPLGNGAAVVYLISPSKAIVADMSPGQANPTISSLQK
jgi:hypothetical protein